MSEETKKENFDSTNEEEITNNNPNDEHSAESEGAEGETWNEADKDAEIQRLKEKLKEKAIKDRVKSRKENTEEKVDTELLDRLNQMELRELGVKDDEDQKIVFDAAKSLGVKPIEAAVNPAIQALLQTNQTKRQAEQATAPSSKKGGSSVRSQVEYWIDKGELPPKGDTELRRKVVNKRIELSKKAKMFNN